MTTPQQETTAVQTLPRNNEVEYIPFGSDDTIKLSVAIIQKFVAIPTKNGHLPDDRDALRFLMLCRSGKLNPFAGDCFLMGFEGRDGDKWSLITAHQAFLKRAEVSPEFDGFESGVIVREGEDGAIIDREGDFLVPGDILLGGWCLVHFKGRKHPMKRRVNLSTFKQPYGRWLDDPAGMVVKVAEADALRSSFPTLLGGMYSENERPVIEVGSVPAKAPEFDTRQPAKLAERTPSTPPVKALEQKAGVASLPEPQKPRHAPAAASVAAPVESPSDDHGRSEDYPEAPGESEPEAPAPAAPTPGVSGESEALKSLRLLMSKSGVTETQVMQYCRENSVAKDSQKHLHELSDAKLLTLGKGFHNVLPVIKGGK